ncbi:hypothetical protein GCM10011508_07160 [Flavobacterium lutivivi]|nr:hypothetical protein GCM10011508_07160 [Flavobacterium lutivivi]
MINFILKLYKRYKLYKLNKKLKKLEPIVNKKFKTSKELNHYRQKNIQSYDLAESIFKETEKLRWELMTTKQRQKEKEISHLMKLKREGKL